MNKIDIIAFDADDTLWHNETLYHQTEEKYFSLLARYIPAENLRDKLYQTEIANLDYFGYGIKSFALSMVENACRLTEGRVSAADLLQIVQFAKDMLDAPVELLPGVEKVIASLAGQYSLMIVTKGDLLDQRRKLARSGLAPYFKSVEIVTDKTIEIYGALFEVHHISPANFLMVGNSLRSDILPIVALGGQAIYIPYHLTWAHEHDIAHFDSKDGYIEIETIDTLIDVLESMQL